MDQFDDPDFKEFKNLGSIKDVEPRLELPSVFNFSLRLSVIYKLIRQFVGKDLSLALVPVFMHEPLSEL